ncbi:MAG: hypothetical protein R3F07_20140 [Opitutaceae bacterium]
MPTPEHLRLEEEARRVRNWKRWGPYLPDRQWGTVREDYSADGSAWESFTHEQARSRAYRWGEDGLLGLTDRECRLCFAPALWNGRDPILKERLFGLTGPEGNHGEDVKELYYHLDATPTHSYGKALYRYPQEPYPYQRLIDENRNRGLHDPEFELADTGIFDENRFFDLTVEYAKAGPDDNLIRLTVENRGPDPASLTLLPTVWFRNTWIWGCRHEGCTLKPSIRRDSDHRLRLQHPTLGGWFFEIEPDFSQAKQAFLFTENETNTRLLYGTDNYTRHVKDAFHRFLIQGEAAAINPEERGTKAAAHCRLELEPGAEAVIRCRLHSGDEAPEHPFGDGFDGIFRLRIGEADAFYREIIPQSPESEEARVQRSAYAGLLWTKKFYHYSVADWLEGDPVTAAPPDRRRSGRNAEWRHLFNRDVLSLPDGWEYPWFAAWDTAFHMIPFAHLDPSFTKDQLILFLREWYLHPNGQIPAYEWAFSDVNPPVHAWACWRVYKMTAAKGERDLSFLKRVFHKLLLNFTWWVNRKDPDGRNIFSGGFLGLDNIGVFDRSRPLPTGGHLEQADGTAWMAFYCTTMLAMALELAGTDESYQDIASKFFEHFVGIAEAINTFGGSGLWNDEDGFYYDQIHHDGHVRQIRVRSMVGLIPLFAVEILDEECLSRVPLFKKRMDWFLTHRQDLSQLSAFSEVSRKGGRHLLAIPSRDQLQRVLARLFDEDEFLSPHGIRSLSRHHRSHPYQLSWDHQTHTVAYEPGESETSLFGGNSNWRGPVWFPVNFLLIEALERYHHYFGDAFRVEVPARSGRFLNLAEAANEISRRLSLLFLPAADGRRPADGAQARTNDPILFHEYFHAETGAGLGASHQTGWTALVAKLLEDQGRRGRG